MFMRSIVAAVVGVVVCASALAEDAYYVLPVSQLVVVEGRMPAGDFWYYTDESDTTYPSVILDGPGEAYVAGRRDGFSRSWQMSDLRIAIHVAAGQAVTGRLAIPRADRSNGKGMEVIKFKLNNDPANKKTVAEFYQAKQSHYERLLGLNIPGGAYFRYQASLAAKKSGGAVGTDRRQNFRPGRDNLGDAYALFTGGRAVSENLQLDRVLPAANQQEPATVDVNSINGITVAEMNWQELTKGLKPQTDPLAALIPADQHAIFFPSFAGMMTLIEQSDRHGTPVLQLAEPRAEDAGTRARYERQMCLSLTGLGRLLGPKVIASVAVTGSDPYLRVGSDVAVLFEPVNGVALGNLLRAQVNLAGSLQGGAAPVNGQIGGISYSGMRSADRRVCSYVAELGKSVVVTNSLAQLQRLVSAHQGKSTAIASLGEYTFFRNRYKRGEEDESALIVLSDATIRRWCSPRWRIGDARRTLAQAVMMDIQADRSDDLLSERMTHDLFRDYAARMDMGSLNLSADGVRSSTYGTLEFGTPIVELELDKVTQAEMNAYASWRDNYQRNWRWGFDPIAIRLTTQANKLAADMTVMPLIGNSEYNEMISISRGAVIDPDAGDLHNALLHYAMAINTKSTNLIRWTNMARGFAPGVQIDPLSWIGQSLAFYVDDDPFWGEMVKAENPEEFMRKNVNRLPVALHVQVQSPFKLAAFMAAIHAFVDQSAPGMTMWETRNYNGQPYVRVGQPVQMPRNNDDHEPEMAVYYAARPDALVVTLNEDLLKRSFDRKAATTQPAAARPTTRPWLGSSFCVQANRKVLDIVGGLSRQDFQKTVQMRAWGNLPILNEYKRLYPDRDPVEVYAKLWHGRLVCPGGGQYVWNEQWKTMESTVYGHPCAPKTSPTGPALLTEFSTGNFGITFENNGLRARAAMERE